MKYPLLHARSLAKEIVSILSPLCDKIEILGSIRREVEEVKDIEIVCVPKTTVGNARVTHFSSKVLMLAMPNGGLKKGNPANGKYVRFFYKQIPVDLFMPPLNNYGYIKMIRTGPKDFCIKIMGEFKRQGYGTDGTYRTRPVKTEVRNLFDTTVIIHEKISFYEEEEVFQLLGMEYVHPRDR